MWGPVRHLYPGRKASITVQFFKRLLQKCCRHRFSWPHTGSYGQDYQVCLICGAAYEFDCATMQRTGRLIDPENLRQTAISPPNAHPDAENEPWRRLRFC